MNVNGVLGSLNFPSLAGFSGQLFYTCEDKDIALELLQAYNDWHIEDWCGTYPGRMIPLAVPPIWDAELMAAEVRRVAEKGCHAVTFSENPEKLGRPSWHSDYWDPFLRACEETGTVICLHIGSSSADGHHRDGRADRHHDHAPADEHRASARPTWSGRRCCASSRTCKIALSEGGIGWVPYFLERIDYVYQHHTSGRTRTSATSCRARCSTRTSSPASSTTPSAWRCATTSTPTTSTGSATTPTPTRRGPTRPRWR